MICGCYGQPLSLAELLYGRLKNGTKDFRRSTSSDADENGCLPDRPRRNRDLGIFRDPGEAQPALNTIKNDGEGFGT